MLPPMRRSVEPQLPDYDGLDDLAAMLEATVRVCINRLRADPDRLAAERVAIFESDPVLRGAAAGASRADYVPIAERLVVAAAARGAIRHGTDRADLTALIALLLPQLAMGALGPGGPDDGLWNTADALSTVRALIDVTGAAFAPQAPG